MYQPITTDTSAFTDTLTDLAFPVAVSLAIVVGFFVVLAFWVPDGIFSSERHLGWKRAGLLVATAGLAAFAVWAHTLPGSLDREAMAGNLEAKYGITEIAFPEQVSDHPRSLVSAYSPFEPSLDDDPFVGLTDEGLRIEFYPRFDQHTGEPEITVEGMTSDEVEAMTR